ncbi:hypothetical protein J5277_28960 [Rhizobium sp. 16-449-1b]|uniref:hypothetical protein n=1 Tax=Rhizobium sp. 16-449-1b TaxID=2819989 RepID=UPI001ADD1C3E|nr:hypothetical protein [Rhizobium sp. 16-449-1b]MBO9198164.1 hypothetical protein [Rhizobium sp. 16-449-1b]
MKVTIHNTGQVVEFKGKKVLRIIASGAVGPSTANTRIDWSELYYVRETPEEVAAMAAAELPTLVQFLTPGGKPVWVNGAKAHGPKHLFKQSRTGGIESAITIDGIKPFQFLSTAPEEVAAVIDAAGGEVLPILSDEMVDHLLKSMQNLTMPIEDPDLGY